MYVYQMRLEDPEKGEISGTVVAACQADAQEVFFDAVEDVAGAWERVGQKLEAECFAEVPANAPRMSCAQTMTIDSSKWTKTSTELPEDELAAARERAKAEEPKPLIRLVEETVNASRMVRTPREVRDAVAINYPDGLTVKDVSSCLSDLVKQGKIARPAKGEYGKLKK